MTDQRSLSYSVPSSAPDWGRTELIATLRCLLTGRIVEGPEKQRLAEEIGDFLQLPYVLPVNRGRCAIELAVRALGVKESDEVVMPSFLCESALRSVRNTGAQTVLADLGGGFHVDPSSIRSKLTARTRCVIVPHLFGETAPIDAIERDLEGTGIALIDDAAQSFGARLGNRLAGTFGTCGILSTGIGKPLEGAAGGALVTRSREIFDRAAALSKQSESPTVVLRRSLAAWVWHRLRHYTLPFKARSDRLFSTNQTARIRPHSMSNLDAAIARQQFEKVGRNTKLRRRNARELVSALGNDKVLFVSDLSAASVVLSAALLLPTRGPTADEAVSALWRLGIEARRGYRPLHHAMGLPTEDFPETEELWDRLVLIPLTRPLSAHQNQALGRGLFADSLAPASE